MEIPLKATLRFEVLKGRSWVTAPQYENSPAAADAGRDVIPGRVDILSWALLQASWKRCREPFNMSYCGWLRQNGWLVAMRTSWPSLWGIFMKALVWITISHRCEANELSSYMTWGGDSLLVLLRLIKPPIAGRDIYNAPI